MREKLQEINQVRATFTGTFERLGTKTSYGYTKQTVLLLNVKNAAGEVVTDHLWFNLTKGFDRLGLTCGDTVQFDARVRKYIKGYRGWRDDVYDKPVETDYKLSHPTKLVKLPAAAAQEMLVAGSEVTTTEIGAQS